MLILRTAAGGARELSDCGCVRRPLEHPDAGQLADRIVVLAFETPGPFSAPGPLAPQDQIDTALAELFSKVDAHKVLVALGSFGMDWTSGTASPVQVDYFDVTTVAVLNDGDVIFDRAHQNSTTSFIDTLVVFIFFGCWMRSPRTTPSWALPIGH